ncbi:hypothetical protein Tco_0608976 [Tanacetum coccineum]
MRTRSQSRRRRQQQTLPVVVETFDLEEPIVDHNIVPMADNRTMSQMLQAPIEGYEDAIVVPPINANNFELKQPLINLGAKTVLSEDKMTIDETSGWNEMKAFSYFYSAPVKAVEEFVLRTSVHIKEGYTLKIHDVIKKEVGKLLSRIDLFRFSDSPWVSPVHCVPKKGGMTVVKNEENELVPTRLVTGWRVCIDYRKLNEDNWYFSQIPMIPKDQGEKLLLRAHTELSLFGDSFSSCLANLDRMLKRCEDTKLALNWEKSHFMVKEGIVLGHKISRKGIEVDKAKVDVISKLPHPTTVKGIQSFLGHAGFYRRFIKDFSKISRPMQCPIFFKERTLFIF